MAIRKCRECGNDVSTSAKTCPKCGVSDPAKSRASMSIMKIMPFVIAAAIIYGIRESRDDTAAPPPATQEAPKPDLDLTKPLFTAKYAALCPKALLTTVYPDKIMGIFTSIFTREAKLKEYGCIEDLPGKQVYVHDTFAHYLIVDYCKPDACSPRFFTMKAHLTN